MGEDEGEGEAARATGRVRATQQLLLRVGGGRGGDPFHDTTAIPALSAAQAQAGAVSVSASQETGAEDVGEFELPAPSPQQLQASALRVRLEARLGPAALLRALDFLENIHEHGRGRGRGADDHDDDDDDDDFLIDQIEGIVGTEQLGYLDDLYTLLALETGEEWIPDGGAGDGDGDEG